MPQQYLLAVVLLLLLLHGFVVVAAVVVVCFQHLSTYKNSKCVKRPRFCASEIAHVGHSGELDEHMG